MLDVTEAAKQIRKILKANFPGIKFSVRSERFSMGSSVEIEWIDGPTGEQVEALVDKDEFKAGYNRYITPTRKYSESFLSEIIAYCKDKNPEFKNESVKIQVWDDNSAHFESSYEFNRVIHQESCKIEFGKIPNWTQEWEAERAELKAWQEEQEQEYIEQCKNIEDEYIDESEENESDSNSEESQEAQEILDARRDRWEEKRERKAEAYERLQEKHSNLSASHYQVSKQISSMIPFGQPILVGHHSERRHRRDADRIHANMGKSIEHQKTSEYYAQKLHNLESNHAISSDDPDAITKLETKLKGMQQCHELMKSANKIIKSKKLNDAEKITELGKLGINEQKAWKLMQPDFCGRIGFASYNLTNNSQNMARVKERIEELKTKLQKAIESPTEEVKYPGLGFTVVRNRELDRLQLMFDGKPPEETRKILKSNGFHWSPSNMAWQRQLNNGAESALYWVVKELSK